MDVPGRKVKEKEAPLTSTVLQLHCTPCKADDRLEIAMGYCEVCHEYLCPACISYHKRLRMSKNHRILLGNDIPSKSTSQPHIDISCSDVCEEHCGNFVEYFCENHDEVGCGHCTIINHRSCKMNFIPEVAQNYKGSNDYKNLKSKVKQVETHIRELEDQLKKQRKEMEDIHSTAINNIRQIRAEVNKFLDEKEEKLLEEVNQLRLENEKALQNVQERRKQDERQIVKIKNQLQTSSNEVTKLFVASKRVKKTIEKINEDCIMVLNKFHITKYNVKASRPFKEILLAENSLGKLVIRHDVCVSRLDLKLLQDVEVPNLLQPNESVVDITGMCMVSVRKLLTADNYSRSLKLVDICNHNLTTLRLTSEPWDVTCLPENQAAVTLPNENKIQIVSTFEGLSPVRQIKVNGMCHGICCNDGKLMVSYLNPGKLELVGLNGSLYWSVSKDNNGVDLFSCPQYVTLQSTADEECFYVSDQNNSTVTKITMGGDIVYQFRDHRLACLLGLVAIGDNHIAVCSSGTKIEVISDVNGKMEIVKEFDFKNISSYPKTVYFSPLDNKLYICFRSGSYPRHKITVSNLEE